MFRSSLLVCAFGFGTVVGAAAQEAAAPAPPAGTTPAFVVQSDNGDNRLQLGMLAQFDGRFFLADSANAGTDTFVLRRFRSITQGQLARHFPFFLNVDFAGGNINLRDAWVETRFSNAFRVRAGKFQAPFSHDRLTLIANLLFVERGLTTAVAPDRETGVQVLGDVAGGRLSYAAALTNGVVDGGATDIDGNDAKDVTGRVVWRPWAQRPAASRLRGFTLAAAGSTGEQAGPLPSFQLPGRQPFFSYDAARATGRRIRWSPQAVYYHGPFGGYAEFVRSRGGVEHGGVLGDASHDAWQVAASWVLTGESAVDQRNVRPRVNFDPPSSHWGALQVAARYQVLAVSDDAIRPGLATRASSGRANVYTVGLNWYLNPFVKWNVNIDHTAFAATAAGPKASETALLLRAHFGF